MYPSPPHSLLALPILTVLVGAGWQLRSKRWNWPLRQRGTGRKGGARRMETKERRELKQWPGRSKKAKSGSSTPHGSGPSTQSSLSACTRCLRRHPHDIANCAATTLWDKNTPVRCEWNKQKRLVNPKGTVLCSDWQRRQGCKSSSHPFRHECSGCGSTEHGAQTCQLAENPDN